ncbi:MAG: FecR family protein [Chitinophagaceae bacterium]
MSEQTRLEILFEKYFQKTANPQEIAELAKLVDEAANKDAVMQLFTNTWQKYEGNDVIVTPERSEEILDHILGKTHSKPARVIRWWRPAAAAAILLFMVSGAWYLLNKDHITKNPVAIQKTITDIQPGTDGAILTLANGKQIILDSAGNGKISDAAVKNGNKISYLDGEKNVAENNTMSTSNGRQFQLILADGSKVWLNAASSITFPTAFTGNERKVSVTGEVYFEVAHNDKIPFIVEHNDISVKVLGTHFNVNTYADETSAQITLLQGSVEVALRQAQGDKTIMLKPSQQAHVTTEIKIVNDVDVNEVIAWKNGLFNFKNADIKEIMRQAARWYDVDVIYEGNISKEKFIGKVARNTNLSEMMKILELNGVKYRIEGKKVIVM